jgi:catechol 2,3-dioxygenase-like lactoylglutathione lyase family enzyme
MASVEFYIALTVNCLAALIAPSYHGASMTRITLFVGILAASVAFAQPSPPRPKILGVAHMAVYVKDLAKTRQFYEDFLGFGEPFTLPQKDGTGTRIVFIKVNDHQYFEIFNEKDRGEGQLNHISFYTDSADRMYSYLKSKGIAVMSDKGSVQKGQTKNKNFNVQDPDGHIVEIVEYQPDSWTAREYGKFMPSTRISDHIMHVGVLVGDLDKSNDFYGGILGFQEFWRGSGSPRMLSWVNMRPAEGQDYLEFMLYDKLPAADGRGTKNHASLTIPDADKALADLKIRAAKVGYDREIVIQTGVNRKRQINLYDPDGTRIELMEPNTVDGKPAPNSTAPVPHPTRAN